VTNDPVYGINMLMKSIIGQVISHKEEEDQAGGKANCEADYVDGRVDFLTLNIPPGDFQIIFEQDVLLNKYHRSINPDSLSLASSISAIPGSASFQRERNFSN
jgi:hypothetical protein